MSEELLSGIVKQSPKKKVTFSIDIDLLKEFDEIIKEKNYKKSQIVENYITEFVTKHKEKN